VDVNDRFYEFIKFEEGLRLEAYRDTSAVWTIGYGHTGPEVHEGQVITEGEAKELLHKDVQWAIDAVNHMVKVPLGQNQFNALVSFVFNVGTGNFNSSTLLRLLNGNAETPPNYAAVPAQLRRWIYDQMGNPVLVNRREREVTLWLAPDAIVSADSQPLSYPNS
jgi:lysozyme